MCSVDLLNPGNVFVQGVGRVAVRVDARLEVVEEGVFVECVVVVEAVDQRRARGDCASVRALIKFQQVFFRRGKAAVSTGCKETLRRRRVQKRRVHCDGSNSNHGYSTWMSGDKLTSR